MSSGFLGIFVSNLGFFHLVLINQGVLLYIVYRTIIRRYSIVKLLLTEGASSLYVVDRNASVAQRLQSVHSLGTVTVLSTSDRCSYVHVSSLG